MRREPLYADSYLLSAHSKCPVNNTAIVQPSYGRTELVRGPLLADTQFDTFSPALCASSCLVIVFHGPDSPDIGFFLEFLKLISSFCSYYFLGYFVVTEIFKNCRQTLLIFKKAY